MNKEEKFGEFWKLYPRKVAKVAAQRSWKRLTNKNIEEIFKVYHEHLLISSLHGSVYIIYRRQV